MKLDQIIVIDIESTCWSGGPPEDQEPEIIEVGVCVLDIKTGERLARHSILVTPERSQVSPFCTNLTSLTQADLDERGVSFGRACAILRRRFGTSTRPWASYGDFDRRQFEKQCRERQIDYPFSQSHINVKSLFALAHGLPREVGLLRAMDALDLPLEGTHHRGVDDAWNTGLILSRLLFQCRGEPVPLHEPLTPDQN